MIDIKISVIIAVYNIEEYIERCLLSIINQSLKEIEIIVVNDGSTDNSLHRIKNIANNEKRIKIVDKENQGLIEARKSGYKISKGKYLLFIDGDDWLEEGCLYKIYETAIQSNSDIVQFNAYKSYDYKKEHFRVFEKSISNSEDNLKNALLNSIRPNIWSKLVRREFLKENNITFPNNISYGEDLATTLNWFIYNPKLSIVEDSLYNYYQRYNSITNVISDTIIDVDKAIQFIEEQLKYKNKYNTYKKEFDYMVFLHLYIYRIIEANKLSDIHEKVYNQYKKRNIDINNIYIKKYIDNCNLYLKFKIKFGLLGYRYCKVWNSMKNIILFK